MGPRRDCQVIDPLLFRKAAGKLGGQTIPRFSSGGFSTRPRPDGAKKGANRSCGRGFREVCWNPSNFRRDGVFANDRVEGSVKDFLDLSDADVEYIELRRALSRLLREARRKLRLTQVEVAARLRTSQSRLAKMEKADPTVSSDLLLRSLFQLGLTRKELAQAI